MRVRLHHPTVHLAVSILDRYLSALLCPPRSDCSDSSDNSDGSDSQEEMTEAEEVEKVKKSEPVKQLLSLPCAMKSLACACVWVSSSPPFCCATFVQNTLIIIYPCVFYRVALKQPLAVPNANNTHLHQANLLFTCIHTYFICIIIFPITSYCYSYRLVGGENGGVADTV